MATRAGASAGHATTPSAKAAAYVTRGLAQATSSQRALPDFVIFGASRCGTTSLFEYLIQHPLVVGPATKEINFAQSVHNYRRGAKWYRSWFPRTSALVAAGRANGRERAITGEGTPNYIAHPRAAARLHDVVPEARLILLLRNPVDRAWSQYRWTCQRGDETLSFAEAVRCESERLPDGFSMMEDPRTRNEFVNHSYLIRGRYADQLPWLFEVYPREQILILRSEDLYSDPRGVYDRVCDHLDLPHYDGVEFGQHNAGTKLGPVDADELGWLADYFSEPNERLRQLTDGAITWP